MFLFKLVLCWSISHDWINYILARTNLKTKSCDMPTVEFQSRHCEPPTWLLRDRWSVSSLHLRNPWTGPERRELDHTWSDLDFGLERYFSCDWRRFRSSQENKHRQGCIPRNTFKGENCISASKWGHFWAFKIESFWAVDERSWKSLSLGTGWGVTPG